MAETRTERKRVNRNQNLWDKIWKDRAGQVVIYQRPNKWLIGWAVLIMISFLTNGHVADFWWYAALVSLSVWGILEVWKGADYFRRFLGVCVLLMNVAALFKVGY